MIGRVCLHCYNTVSETLLYNLVFVRSQRNCIFDHCFCQILQEEYNTYIRNVILMVARQKNMQNQQGTYRDDAHIMARYVYIFSCCKLPVLTLAGHSESDKLVLMCGVVRASRHWLR